ncbi:MAG: DUF4350 domain-containing protein [Blastocatellia bacterium]|nr:DUF4350 domain-containing protein [Blastocatellia bacterium]
MNKRKISLYLTRALALSFVLLTGLAGINIRAQQVADTAFNPPIEKPAYAKDGGPVVAIDEAHYNFHTADGRYLAFANLLRRDGYIVKGSSALFSKDSLNEVKILVIANALAERNREDWSLPTPSAFSDKEISAVRDWVKAGGSLFLIADHMPCAGAAEKLGAAFGFKFSNGYAMNEKARGGPMIFRKSDRTLRDHPITRGRIDAEKVEAVATFTGSAFQAGKDAEPVLVFGPDVVSFETKVAGEFPPETPRVPVSGWLHGAVLKFGKGRVAIFGEAAMFSAQLAGPNRRPMGMNAPVASENPKFLLNIMHWLSGLL